MSELQWLLHAPRSLAAAVQRQCWYSRMASGAVVTSLCQMHLHVQAAIDFPLVNYAYVVELRGAKVPPQLNLTAVRTRHKGCMLHGSLV